MFRLAFVVSTVALLAACDGIGDRCSSASAGAGDTLWTVNGAEWRKSGKQPSAALTPGTRITVGLDVSVTKSCVVAPTDIEFTAKVLDASGVELPIETVTDRFEQENHFETKTAVTFTPPRAGSYRIEVSLAPSIRVETRSLLVFDNPAAPALITTLQNVECGELAQTSAGNWLCSDKLFRAGTEADTVPGKWVVSGADIWQVLNGKVRVLEDTGSGPLQVKGVTFADAPSGNPNRLLVAGGDLLVVTLNAITRYHADATGTVQSGVVQLTSSFAPSLVAESNGYVAAAAYSQYTGTTVCTFALPVSGGIEASAGPCAVMKDLVPLAAADGVIWLAHPTYVKTNATTSSPGQDQLTAVLITGDHAQQLPALELPETYSATSAVDAAPIVVSELESVLLSVEHPSSPTLTPLGNVTKMRAVGSFLLQGGEGAKVTKIYSRPTAPASN